MFYEKKVLMKKLKKKNKNNIKIIYNRNKKEK